MEREFKSRSRYFWAFVIGTVVFVLVFALSYYMSYLEFNRIANLQVGTSFEIFEDKLDYSFFDEGMCTDGSFERVSEDLGFQGRIIDDLERKLGKDDARVLLRKKFYTLVEIEHLEFVNFLNEECNLGKNTILFFYSNEAGDLEDSEELGRLLGSVSSRNEDLIIYSFDVNLQSGLIDKLKEKYGVEAPLTLIVNENLAIINPTGVDEIEEYLE